MQSVQPSLHHQVASRRVHPHVGQRLPGRLHGGLARALVQLFLTALRDLAALDFGARTSARRSPRSTLRVPVGPNGLGVQRERAVGVDERIAVGITPSVPSAGSSATQTAMYIGLSISTFGSMSFSGPQANSFHLRVVRAPQVRGVGLAPGADRSPCSRRSTA